MMSVTRSTLSPYLKATTTAVNACKSELVAPVATKKKENIHKNPYGITRISGATLRSLAPKVSQLLITSSTRGSQTVRYAHSDIKFPDYTEYRRESVKSPTSRGHGSAADRNAFTYLMTGGLAVGSIYSAKTIVGKVVGQWSAPPSSYYLGILEIKLGDIPEGKDITMKFRGRPLFIRHRTAEQIDTESKVNVSELRDPQADTDRVKRPEWLILIGVCTHLGCTPIAKAGNYGGYFCPCHGSHYDGSGRIRQGPAPLNLAVPPYMFNDAEGTVVVGLSS